MTLPRLSHSGARRPKTGIVHLGLGAFFRGFGCAYVADAMAASGGAWGIIGVSLRSPDTRDALREQGWAYTAVSLAPNGVAPRVIEVLNDVLVAPEDPQRVMDVLADPAVKILSLTVTEKGYCHSPATGTLNLDHPDIIHDMGHDLPRSALGIVVRSLQARKDAGQRPFSVLTCDNLPQNGRLVRQLVLEMAEQIDPELARWIAGQGRFPSTMVDRITPATTPEDIVRVGALTGYHDAAPVMHEPFGQWVVEDAFVDDARPDLAAVGVDMVADVTAYEDMKLRMLNGTHSALAYSGYLAGHETIADTVADPVFARFVRGIWDEIIPTVTPPDGVDLRTYADALFDRYANPNIRHRTWQIAMDGSQKLPQRLLGPLADTFDRAGAAPMLCLSVAAWMRYVGGLDDAGQPIDVRDPLADRLGQLARATDTPDQQVAALLSVREIFPEPIATQLLNPVTQAARLIAQHGTRTAIAQMFG